MGRIPASNYYAGWFQLGGQPEVKRLTPRQRVTHTIPVLLLAAVVFVFFDRFAAIFVMAAGAWVVWTPHDRLTRWRRVVFWFVFDGFVLLSVVKVAVQADVGLLPVVAMVAHLVFVGGRA